MSLQSGPMPWWIDQMDKEVALIGTWLAWCSGGGAGDDGSLYLFLYGNDQTVAVFAVKPYELNIQTGCNVLLLIYLFDKPDKWIIELNIKNYNSNCYFNDFNGVVNILNLLFIFK